MTTEPQLLEGSTDTEKTAYFKAIASLATADRQATDDELSHIEQLCEAAGLSADQTSEVTAAATETSGEALSSALAVLKNSDLKHSLVTDLIAFSKSDQNYSEQEQQLVQQIAQHLGVDEQQFSLLNQFAETANSDGTEVQETGPVKLASGLQEKMQSAGINTGSLMKGVLAMAAPFILSKIFGGRNSGAGGGLGGMLGGMLGGGMLGGGGGMGGGGGLGGMLGGNNTGGGIGSMLGGGGLGSLISMISGGGAAQRGGTNGTGGSFGGVGGLLSKVINGRF